MFYLYFLSQLIGIILLSPLRWTLNFVVRFLWKDIKFDFSVFKSEPSTSIHKYTELIKLKLKSNINKIIKHGDSAKFVSLLALYDDDFIPAFKGYIKDCKFYRKQYIKDKGNFSGDMFAGYSYAFYRLYLKCKLDKEFIGNFKCVLEKSLFDEPYLTFKSECDKYDRGYLLRWFFGNAGHFLPLLTTLQLLHLLTKEVKYKALYWLVFPIAFVDILVNPTFFIRIGNLRYSQWYYVHSNWLYYRTLYTITKSWIYKYALSFIKRRFWFNPEFTSDCSILYLWLTDYTHRNKKPKSIPIEKIKVYNIKDLIRRKKKPYYYEYTKIVPPRFRWNDYQWEKDLLSDEWNYSILSGIDYIVVYERYKVLRGEYG